MEEASPEREPKSAPTQPVFEDRTFVDVLKSFIGKVITVVNPESYEDAPLGHDIRKGWYPAKPVGMGVDYLIVVTEYKHAGKKATKEPVKQFIPLARIKRISQMKSELLIHI